MNQCTRDQEGLTERREGKEGKDEKRQQTLTQPGIRRARSEEERERGVLRVVGELHHLKSRLNVTVHQIQHDR